VKRGFTLIELLLVLAILGIMTAITIPAFLQHRRHPRPKPPAADYYHVNNF
jgi:prepilin-type N-terminal cleavage/methylation domain-containing protein